VDSTGQTSVMTHGLRNYPYRDGVKSLAGLIVVDAGGPLHRHGQVVGDAQDHGDN
jgi:hypothetical protein